MLFFTQSEDASKYRGTCPKLVGICGDSNNSSFDRYILKPFFKNRTDGLDEFLSALLGKALNLQIPDFDICYVKLNFLSDDCWNKEEKNIHIIEYKSENYAMFFASKFTTAHKAVNIPLEYKNMVNSNIESYMLEFFDLNILNWDRSLDNLLINENGFVIIDHNIIFCGYQFEANVIEYIKSNNCEKIVIDKFKIIKKNFLLNDLILYSEAKNNFLNFDMDNFCNDLELNIAKLNFKFTDIYKLAIDRRKEILKYQNRQIGGRYENNKTSSN